MNPLSLLDPAVTLLHTLLRCLAAQLEPVLGGSAVAVSLLLITLVVRCLLVPLSVRVAAADRARRALSPTLEALRSTHAGDPARMLREVQDAHRRAGTSQFAGLLPALAQAPLLMVVYRLCSTPVIAGNPNVVLVSNLFGTPLAQHGLAVINGSGVLSGPALVVGALLVLLLLVACWSSWWSVARLRVTVPRPEGTALLLARVMPFSTVAFALFVPVAVSLYLLASTTWATAERILLARAG